MRHYESIRRITDLLSFLTPKRSRLNGSPRRIGVLLQWGIGDAVLVLPFLRALRAHFPSATIELIGKPFLPDLMEGEGIADAFHMLVPPWTNYAGKYRVWKAEWRRYLRDLMRVRRHEFDLVVSLRWDPRELLQLRLLRARATAGYGGAGGRKWVTTDLDLSVGQYSALHRAEVSASAARTLLGRTVSPDPALRPDPARMARARARLRRSGHTNQKLLIVHGSAGRPTRQWGATNFNAVLNVHPNRDLFIVIVQDTRTDGIAPPLGVLGLRWSSSLADLKALFGVADLLLCNDSGPMHVAAACGCPLVAIFGPGSLDWFGPRGQDSRVVAIEPMPCRPCDDKCIYETPICMSGITRRMVVDSLRATREARQATTCADS